jgi:hypothetical protein
MTTMITTYRTGTALCCATNENVYTHVVISCKIEGIWVAHVLFDGRIDAPGGTTFIGSSQHEVIDKIQKQMKEHPAFADMHIAVNEI